MKEDERYKLVKDLFEKGMGKRLGAKVSSIGITPFAPGSKYTVMEGEKSIVYRLPLEFSVEGQPGSVKEKWVLKIYDNDKIEPDFVKREVEIANLVHAQDQSLVPEVLAHQIKGNETYLLLPYVGKTVGKHYIRLTGEERSVLLKVQKETLKGGEDEILEWLKFMNFISEENGRYKWESSTLARFDTSGLLRENFHQKHIAALEGAINTKYRLESLINGTLEEEVRKIVGKDFIDPTEEFFRRFKHLAVFAGLEKTYGKEKSELEDLFVGTIAEIRRLAEKSYKALTTGNSYLFNSLEEDNTGNSTGPTIVKTTDLYHVTEGHWLTGDIDIVAVASARHHGLNKSDVRALWLYNWSRAVAHKVVGNKDSVPLALQAALTFERLGFFTATACRQLCDKDTLTAGSERERLRTIGDLSSYLTNHLKHHMTTKKIKVKPIDTKPVILNNIFSDRFVEMYSKYFMKINEKSKDKLKKKGGK